MILPDPDCERGYTTEQLRLILADRFEEFGHWMRGQTMSICEGRRYNHEDAKYVPACGGVAHGVVVYSWDLENFLKGWRILD